MAEERLKPSDIWVTGRRVDVATRDRGQENRLVVRNTDRAFYALGVLGVEGDLDKMELRDEEKDGDGDDRGASGSVERDGDGTMGNWEDEEERRNREMYGPDG